jgi:hypothetical protein
MGFMLTFSEFVAVAVAVVAVPACAAPCGREANV